MSRNFSHRGGRSRSRGPQLSQSRPQYATKKRGQRKKDYIHPSKFVKAAQPTTKSSYEAKNRFSDFELHELIMANVTAMGFDKPSPIQDQAIPHALEGRDVVGIANTGTGKTAAFGIPMLNRLITDKKSKAIILAPTRELAQQIEQQCRLIAKGSGLDGALLIGGTPMRPQLNELKYNPRIVIGTPGRTKDHLERKSLDISDFNLVVLDEVDRMLDMGFVNDIRHILGKAADHRQSFYFSATLDERVKGIIEGFSYDPVHISIKSGETNSNIEQNVVMYEMEDHKINKLHDILTSDSTAKAIIFDDTQRSVEKLSKELVSRGFSTDAIHGGKSQSQRQRVLKKFKENEISVLVATDVAARGLDVSDITHVINYSLPQSYDDYVHRIGRTGRAGKTGFALTFVSR